MNLEPVVFIPVIRVLLVQQVEQMKLPHSAILSLLATTVVLARADISHAADLVTFEAESGAPGSDWGVSNSSSPAFITILTDGAGNYPASAARVASYTVTFPTAGTY